MKGPVDDQVLHVMMGSPVIGDIQRTAKRKLRPR
ncbi:hypothetical protein BH23ACT6_BH23ACT6_22100 [soil metagenome]